jgi:hypothetical protein
MYVIVIEIEIERLSLQIVATASLEEEDEDGQLGSLARQCTRRRRAEPGSDDECVDG